MRLKKEHDGYSSSGLWLKYQRPTINERSGRPKKGLDKKKWCGKKGVEHQWHRYQQLHWDREQQEYVQPAYEQVTCFVCGQHRSHKIASNKDLPLHVWVEQENGSYAVQLSVNGEYKPIKQLVYRKDVRWCWECQRYHSV